MFKNYIKLAFKVLARRKFFTFISLFGISLTLMILMTITAVLDNELGAHPPISDIDKMAFIHEVSKKRIRIDTVYDRDTSVENGIAKIDSTMRIRESNDMTSTSSASFSLLDNHFRKLPYVENYCFYAQGRVYDVFKNNAKIAMESIYVDASYWQVFDFPFIEGGPFSNTAVQNQEQVVIINKKTKEAYFGSEENVLGKEMLLEGKHFKVLGVIGDFGISRPFVKSDLYLPYTHMQAASLNDPDLLGSFEAAFTLEKSSRLKALKAEVKRITGGIELPADQEFNHLEVNALTFVEIYSQNLIYNEDATVSKYYMILILSGLLGLFIFLPTINLININVTRILERSSEIGVRKAFGANQSNLLTQFVFENIVLSLIGGIIGLVLAVVLIFIINDSQVLGDSKLSFQASTFFYSFLISLFFGIISGFIPAWRMSKIHIVNALKENVS